MGEWQKVFVNNLVDQIGLTHDNAMKVMGIVCDMRQVAYMDGYNRGWDASKAESNDTKSRMRTALESIAANTCCDSCREAALVAKKALEEKE